MLLSELGRYLPKLYPDAAGARRIATLAGMDVALVSFQSSAAVIWVDLLRQATSSNKLELVLHQILSDYPNDAYISGILDRGSESVEDHSSVAPLAQGGPIEDVAVSRYALLVSRVVEQSKDTISNLLSSSLFLPVRFKDALTGSSMSLVDLLMYVKNKPESKVLIVGPSGAGKSLSLVKLFIEEDNEHACRFVFASSLGGLLQSATPPMSESCIPLRLYLDGIDELLTTYDAEKTRNLGKVIGGWRSVVATSRDHVVHRQDVKSNLLRYFSKIVLVEEWRESEFWEYLAQSSGGESDLASYISFRDFPFRPIFAVLLSKLLEPKSYSRRWRGENPPSGIEGLSYLYGRFIESWCFREADRSGVYNLGLNERILYWKNCARDLHRERVTGMSRRLFKEVAWSRAKGSDPIADSLLRFDGKGGADFVHPSFLDYFSALAYLDELLYEPIDLFSPTSMLVLPSSYEVNAFLRGELALLKREGGVLMAKLTERLDELWEKSSENRIGTQAFVARNNIMYFRGRLGVEGARNLEEFFEREMHPLVRYTIGMNGMLLRVDSLSRRVLRAVMFPKNPSDVSIQEANLFCHLYYYGDIPSLELPKKKISWPLTQKGLARHFALGESGYRPFWAIDLVTAVQLLEKYGGSRRFISKHLSMLNDDIDGREDISELDFEAADYVRRRLEEIRNA
jgi:hypothetical protein